MKALRFEMYFIAHPNDCYYRHRGWPNGAPFWVYAIDDTIDLMAEELEEIYAVNGWIGLEEVCLEDERYRLYESA